MYRTGYVANSYHLTEIIHAAMRDEGWSLVSGINENGTDSVFYSDGEDGYQDIYVRVAAGLRDRRFDGDVQFPDEDGYSGFVNFFSYQYFPDEGAASDGCGEVGRYGPLLYIWDGRTGYSNIIEEYNLFSSTAPNGYRRIVQESAHETDGAKNWVSGRYVYYKPRVESYIWRWDLGTYPTSYTRLNATNNFFISSLNAYPVHAAMVRSGPLDLTIWNGKRGDYDGGGWSTYNVITGDLETDYLAPPPWGTGSQWPGGWALQGSRRNGKNLIYVGRGGHLYDVAYYDIDENVWTSLPDVPYKINEKSQAVIVPKEVTGYTYDRLYAKITYVYSPATRNFVSIALSDDGHNVGGWYDHGVHTSDMDGNYGDYMFYGGGDRLFLILGGDDEIWEWVFPSTPTGASSWTKISSGWLNRTANSTDGTFIVRDHLLSRVEVDEGKATKYWLLVNKDRVAVITKTIQSTHYGKYNTVYAGLFETFYDTTFTMTDGSTSAGATTIYVDDTSMFKIGTKYKIVGMESGGTITGFNGEVRGTAPCEIVTVSGVSQSNSSITVGTPLQNSYSDGAKIAVDVQPVGVSIDGLDQIQTINGTSAVSVKKNIDPPYQSYTMKKPQQEICKYSERENGNILWPVLLVHDERLDDSTPITSSDVRGKLIGIYLVSDEVDSEKVLTIGDDRYIVFSVYGSRGDSNNMAFGPME